MLSSQPLNRRGGALSKPVRGLVDRHKASRAVAVTIIREPVKTLCGPGGAAEWTQLRGYQHGRGASKPVEFWSRYGRKLLLQTLRAQWRCNSRAQTTGV
jgi:hypothetical protein